MVILLALPLASVYEPSHLPARKGNPPAALLAGRRRGPARPAVIASFAVSYAGYDWVAGLILAFCVTTLSPGAGLSVARYRLYDVVVTDPRPTLRPRCGGFRWRPW
jgi:hypothetical protein